MRTVGIVEPDCVILRIDDEPTPIWPGISCFTPDFVDGGDFVAEPSRAVLPGLACGADLGGRAVGVAHSESAEWILVIVFDAGQSEVEKESEIVVVKGANR